MCEVGSNIEETFMAKFERLFKKTKPEWGEVKVVFDWLKHEGICSKSFEDLEAIDKLRRGTESHFAQFKFLRKKVEKESKLVNSELKKRYEELRQIHLKRRGKVPIVEGEHEVDKIPPPH